MSIESKAISGVTKYRGVPQVKGQKRHTPWVKTRAEASMLEAELRMSMGGQVVRSGHTVGSVVAGYLDDASDRLKPDSTTYYRTGQASIPPVFSDRLVSELNTVLLDSLYRELRNNRASAQIVRRLHSTLSASFSRAVKNGWMASNPCRSATKPSVKAEPWRPEYLTHSYAGLQGDGSSVHGLRHFHATQLLSKGVPVTQVSHRLGHSSPTVTMNTYAHWIPADDQTSAELVGSVLDE